MISRWPAGADLPLVGIVRALPRISGVGEGGEVEALLARAERHGLAGVVDDALREAGVELSPELARRLDAARVARELDHAAHLALLGKIDDALAGAGVAAVALKGALLGERLYARPAARATSDVDLLVREGDVDVVTGALEGLGFRGFDDPEEARFRREHHHLHFGHAHAMPLELHFHAYRGFGRVLPSEPLVERRVAFAPLRAIGVLAPADELVYLAVHAAAHRFTRLAWLYDMKLLVARMTPEELDVARRRALEWGYGRAVAFAADLLVDALGVPRARVGALRGLGPVRRRFVMNVVDEPRGLVLRSATRFVYTTTLCDSPRAAARYARQASLGHAKRLLGFGP